MDCFVRPIYDLLFPPGKSGEGATTPLFDTPTTPHPSREAAEKAKQEAEAEERERMQLLVSSFTEDQLDRCQNVYAFLGTIVFSSGMQCTAEEPYQRQPSRR